MTTKTTTNKAPKKRVKSKKHGQIKAVIKPGPDTRPDAIKISKYAKEIVFEKAIEMSLELGRLVNLREALDDIVIAWKSGLSPDDYRAQKEEKE